MIMMMILMMILMILTSMELGIPCAYLFSGARVSPARGRGPRGLIVIMIVILIVIMRVIMIMIMIVVVIMIMIIALTARSAPSSPSRTPDPTQPAPGPSCPPRWCWSPRQCSPGIIMIMMMMMMMMMMMLTASFLSLSTRQVFFSPRASGTLFTWKEERDIMAKDDLK